MGNDSGKYRNAKGGALRRSLNETVILSICHNLSYRTLYRGCLRVEGTATRRQPLFRNAAPGASRRPAESLLPRLRSRSDPNRGRSRSGLPRERRTCGRSAESAASVRRVRFSRTAPTAMSRCAPYGTRASLRPARPCDSKRCGSREDPTGSTAPGGVPAAATSGYGRSVTRAAERFRLVTAGGDDRGRGCDAEARAAPDAAIGPGRAGSRARAAG